MVNRSLSPLNELLSLREAMNQLVESSVIRPGAFTLSAGGTGVHSFPVNVYQVGEELKVEALLPGISPEEVHVELDRGVLTINARRQGWQPTGDQPQGQSWHIREILPGQFTRSFALPFPAEAEQVTADFSNGVLTLTVPKAEVARPRRIQITAGHPHEQPQLTTTTPS